MCFDNVADMFDTLTRMTRSSSERFLALHKETIDTAWKLVGATQKNMREAAATCFAESLTTVMEVARDQNKSKSDNKQEEASSIIFPRLRDLAATILDASKSKYERIAGHEEQAMWNATTTERLACVEALQGNICFALSDKYDVGDETITLFTRDWVNNVSPARREAVLDDIDTNLWDAVVALILEGIDERWRREATQLTIRPEVVDAASSAFASQDWRKANHLADDVTSTLPAACDEMDKFARRLDATGYKPQVNPTCTHV